MNCYCDCHDRGVPQNKACTNCKNAHIEDLEKWAKQNCNCIVCRISKFIIKKVVKRNEI